ncbi:MAG: 30S ribosomal protein S11 [Candidatus Dojkabacteria bacterium]
MAKTTKAKIQKTKKQKKKSIPKGKIFINATYNNTLLTFTDTVGQVHAWSSAGVVGFKGSRKSTPYAGQRAANDLNTKIAKYNVQEVDVFLKGAGAAKQLTVKELGNGNYRILSLVDNTPLRFGGTRPRKKPRN